MLRISLIIALLAGLAAGAVGVVYVKQKMVTTMNERDSEKSAKEAALTSLKKTEKELATTKDNLKNTQEKLASTESELKTVTARADELDKQKVELTSTLEKTRADRDAAQQELNKWDIVHMKPEEVKALQESYKKTIVERDTYIKENKVMLQKNNDLQAKIDYYFGKERIPDLPAGLKGKILAVDPKFQFVVLDIGGNQGVISRGQMLVNRNGKLMGKISIATVDSTHSVANIMPEWQQGEFMEGDQVITTSVN